MVPDLKPMNVGFFSKIMLMYTQTIFCLFETCTCMLLKTTVEICSLISQNEMLRWLLLQIVIITRPVNQLLWGFLHHFKDNFVFFTMI